MQKQLLWHNFQEKNKQLEMQHKIQLEHKYQVRVQFAHSKCSTLFIFFSFNFISTFLSIFSLIFPFLLLFSIIIFFWLIIWFFIFHTTHTHNCTCTIKLNDPLIVGLFWSLASRSRKLRIYRFDQIVRENVQHKSLRVVIVDDHMCCE